MCRNLKNFCQEHSLTTMLCPSNEKQKKKIKTTKEFHASRQTAVVRQRIMIDNDSKLFSINFQNYKTTEDIIEAGILEIPIPLTKHHERVSKGNRSDNKSSKEVLLQPTCNSKQEKVRGKIFYNPTSK